MMPRWLPCLVVTAVLASTALLDGQSLAEVARREEERRKRIPVPSRVYTDRDLARPRGGVRPVPSAPLGQLETSGGAGTSAPPPAIGESDRANAPQPRQKRDEQHWRERAKLIRDRLDRLRADTAAVEGRVASLRADLDSARPPRATSLANELRQANDELPRFQSELRYVEQEWATFEQRAHQAKVPSSWLQ